MKIRVNHIKRKIYQVKSKVIQGKPRQGVEDKIK